MDWLMSAARAAESAANQAGVQAVNWSTWVWMLALSCAGGWVSFYQKLRSGQARPWNVTELIGELIGELVISAFAGAVTFFLCKGTGMNEFLTAALVGISGHMGSRAVLLFERQITRRIEKLSK